MDFSFLAILPSFVVSHSLAFSFPYHHQNPMDHHYHNHHQNLLTNYFSLFSPFSYLFHLLSLAVIVVVLTLTPLNSLQISFFQRSSVFVVPIAILYCQMYSLCLLYLGIIQHIASVASL